LAPLRVRSLSLGVVVSTGTGSGYDSDVTIVSLYVHSIHAVVGRYVYCNHTNRISSKQVEKSGEFISRLNLALIPITSAPLQCGPKSTFTRSYSRMYTAEN